LAIFDTRGCLLAVLLSSELTEGPHEIAWNAEELASGVYLAQLETASGRSSIRLILLK
jgi:hypothetical protein